MKLPSRCSATSINALEHCPTKYNLAYVEGLRPAEKTEALRIGTQYQLGREILDAPDGDEDTRLDLAIAAATKPYETPPTNTNMTPTDWLLEKTIVRVMLTGYQWLYPHDDNEWEAIGTEVSFDLPIINPDTGRPTPNMTVVGRMDSILRHKQSGKLAIGENKTTSKPIDSGSSYWGRLRLDVQSRLYILAGRMMQQRDGCLYAQGEPVLTNLIHEVAKRPTIKPKMLTQSDTYKFVETGQYFGGEFAVEVGSAVVVDGVTAEVKAGKKEGSYAIRETPEMFGERFLNDITLRPEFYYARKEVPFTDAEILSFQGELWSLQKMMHSFANSGHWYHCGGACETMYECPYTSICYNRIDVSDGQTPPGFVRYRQAEAEQMAVGVE